MNIHKKFLNMLKIEMFLPKCYIKFIVHHLQARRSAIP